MTEKEKEIMQEMLLLIENIKEHTADLDTDYRTPDLELDVILSKIEKLHQSAIILKFLHRNVDEIIDTQHLKESQQKAVSEETIKQQHKENVPEKSEDFDIEKIQKDLSSFDLLNNSGLSNNEKIETKDTSLVNKLSRQPISDLKAAISLNDKFIFIQELFKGDVKLYEQTINELNHAADKSVAEIVLSRLGFNRNSESVANFMNLVERRFL